MLPLRAQTFSKMLRAFVLICGLRVSLSAYTTTPFFCDDPNPVTDLEVTVSNYSHFALTWTPPSNVLQRCIHAYKVCISPVQGGNVSCSSTWRGYFNSDANTRTTVCTNYTASVYVEGYPAFSNVTSVNFYTGAAKVRQLKASNTTPTATQLSWRSPETLTCASHYKLYQYACDDSADDCPYQTITLPINTTRATLRGLESCKKNTVRLATVDQFGGENHVPIVVRTGNGQPPKLQDITTGNNQGSSIDVWWEPPLGFSSQCHGGYRVCSFSERGDDRQCYFTNLNKLTIRKLNACSNYTIQVETVDGELREENTRSAAISKHVFTNPELPWTTVGFGEEQIGSLAWEVHDNHSALCLHHYEVEECVERPSTGRCEVLHTTTLPVNARSFNTSSKLTDCAASHLYFYAVANNGDKSHFDFKFINDIGNLHAPTNLSVVSATPKHITLAWTHPEFNECPHSYRVCWNLAGYRTCESSDRETGDTFSNLTLYSCHAYTLSVWQMYKKKTSSAVEVTMPIGPENAGHQSVEVKPTSALMTWWRDTAAHRCNTGYRITWCPASIFSNTCGQSPTGTVSLPDTVSRYNITGLEMCVEYLLVFETLGHNESLTSEPNATIVHTPIERFGPITDLSIAQRENNTVTLAIVFPYNSKKCITKFTTCLYETDSEDTEKYCRLMRTEWVNMTQPCTNYTVDITAITYNKLTSNGSTTFATGPGHVNNVSVTEERHSASANVSWVTPGAKYSRCVLYLDVSCTPAEASEPVLEQRLPAEATGVRLEGLSNCTSYTLQIQAVAAGGVLGKAAVKQFATTWSALEKVQDLKTNASGRHFSVSWQPPQHSECLASYRICWGSEGTEITCETTFTNKWMSSEIDILQPCTSYTVWVATLDRYGKSSDNVTETFHTGAAEVTGVTTNVSASREAVTVKWTYPEANVRCVSYQTVTFTRIQDNVVLVKKRVSKESTESSYNGLERCLRYKVEVEPITLDGASPLAVAKNFHVPSNVNSLSGLEVAALGQDALHINYSITEVSSYCVDHFLICWEASGINTSCSNKQGHTSSSVNITGLSPATNYTVHVTPVAPDGSRYTTTSATATTLQCDSCTGGETTVRNQLSVVLFLPALLLLRRWP